MAEEKEKKTVETHKTRPFFTKIDPHSKFGDQEDLPYLWNKTFLKREFFESFNVLFCLKEKPAEEFESCNKG